MVEDPKVSHVITNFVMVCSCPASVVMVMPFGDQVSCPACQQKYELDYMTVKGTADDEGRRMMRIEVRVKPASDIVLPGAHHMRLVN